MTKSLKQSMTPPKSQSLTKIQADALREFDKKGWEGLIREPIAYIQKWVTKLIHEAAKAPGYTPREKQVTLMNLRKVDVELQVSKLILKEDVFPFISHHLSLAYEAGVREAKKEFRMTHRGENSGILLPTPKTKEEKK